MLDETEKTMLSYPFTLIEVPEIYQKFFQGRPIRRMQGGIIPTPVTKLTRQKCQIFYLDPRDYVVFEPVNLVEG